MPKDHPDAFRAREANPTTKPVFLYVIDYRDELIHLTNYDTPVTVTGLPVAKGTDPQVFTPAQISHTSADQSSDIGSNQIQVMTAINGSALSQQLRQHVLSNPPDRITFTVIRANSNVLPDDIVWGEDTFVVFKGVATTLVMASAQISVQLVSMLLRGDGKVPRCAWQKTCQHALYGEFCGADRTAGANRIQTVVSAVSVRARTVTLPDILIGATPIEAYMFQGGTIWERQTSYIGTVLSKITVTAVEVLPASAGIKLYLPWWSQTIGVGSLVELHRGCRRILTDCQSFHPLLENSELPFMGFPWVPDVTPAIHGV